MKLVIDQTLCQGHGQCEEVAPDLFQVRDDGVAYPLKDVQSDDEVALAREAVRRCPADAIILSD